MNMAPNRLPSRGFGKSPERIRLRDQEREPQKLARAVSWAGGVSGVPVEKESPVRSNAIRKSAKGEDCTVRLPGCPHDPEQTIWSHYRGGAGGKGGALKASDVAGAYACTHCDAVYDGQRPRPDGMTKDAVDLAWLEGHIRSLVRLRQKNLLDQLGA